MLTGKQATHSSTAFNGIFLADATYIIIGGTGGIGRSATSWMVRNGAKNIVLVSRSDKISAKVAEVIQDAKELGATVILRRCDVSDKQEVESMVKEITAEMPPVRGVIHSAMVLDVSLSGPLYVAVG